MKVIKENLDLPNTFTLGKCANPGVNFDNYSGGECSATWTFELIQMKKLKKGDV